MNKLNIDDNYIKTSLKELDNNLSVVQMTLLFIATILVSMTIGLNSYVTDLTRLIVAVIVFILAVVYVYIELKRNNLIENWNIKESKINLNKKDDKIKDEYKVKVDGYKGTATVPYEEYKDLNNESIGYAIVIEKQKKLLLWFDKNKYNYNK
jgi:Ca2+/Na+ antiporter